MAGVMSKNSLHIVRVCGGGAEDPWDCRLVVDWKLVVHFGQSFRKVAVLKRYFSRQFCHTYHDDFVVFWVARDHSLCFAHWVPVKQF